jgi:asparagine synthase (glutamine-hydrolysing)
MRSDVPVGACLSGGLDSSAIAALVELPADRPMHCFSLRYEGWSDDESRFAARAAGDRFVLHWVSPEPTDLLGTIRKIVWHHDAPTPIRGRLGSWHVLEEAGRHVKVVLDGQGGDELLAGYSRFVLPYLADRLRRPDRSLFRETADLALIESRSRLWFLALASIRALRSARQPRSEGPYRSRLNNALWHELRSEGLPEVLHAEDAISMAFSVEARTPFLDHRLVELCFSLPFTEKIADGWTKSLLRRSLAGDVPREILERRRKLGFSSPAAAWLRREETMRSVRELLLDRSSLERGLFDRRRLETSLRAFERGPSVYAAHRVGRLWRWITLELWFQEFQDRPPGDPGPS